MLQIHKKDMIRKKNSLRPSLTQARFIAIMNPEPSNATEHMRYRRANRDWLFKSAHIAVELLSAMDEKGITRAELGRQMSAADEEVSRWLSGEENFRLDTLVRLEKVLGVVLVL